MNSEIEIVDFSEKYISDVLNVLYESNIQKRSGLFCQNG